MRISYIILFCLPFLFSCEMKKDLLGGGKDSEDEKPSYENIGLLNLKLKPEKEAEVPGTKVDDESLESELNPEDFRVAILDSTGLTVAEYESYADMEDDGKLLLPAGKYMVKASYGNNLNAGFNSPYYTGDTSCVVSEKEVVNLVAECRLGNKKVQFVCTDDFLSQFTEDYSIVIDNGEGALKLEKEEKRIAYLKNTGVLRFTMYATTHNKTSHTFTHDLSKDDLVNSHNNVLIALGTVTNVPDGDDNNNNNKPDDSDNSGEPEQPDDSDDSNDPDNPDDSDNTEKPVIPVKSPVIKVDVSLVEKDYVIEIPSNFVESDKPDTGGDDNNQGGGSGDDNQGGSDTQKKISITGTLNGKSFNLGTTQTVTASSKVVINLYLPTGLDALDVYVQIGSEIKLPVDLLDASSVASINDILSGLGKKLTAPSKGEKGNLKFDISPFMSMLESDNSFKVTVKDKNGESTNATIKLTKK